MKNQTFFLVAFVACLAVGCSSMELKPERSHSLAAIYPVGGKPIALITPSGHPVNCPGSGDTDSCVIPITVTDPSCDADKIVLEDFVKLGDIGAKKKVVWRLPAGYVFCQRAGDGVFLKDPNAPIDLFDPVDQPMCAATFEWKRKKSDSNDYEYLLRFRSANKVCGVKDPWIRN